MRGFRSDREPAFHLGVVYRRCLGKIEASVLTDIFFSYLRVVYRSSIGTRATSTLTAVLLSIKEV